MLRKQKKQSDSLRRSPHIVRQKQATFQYSSNRAPSERTSREQPQSDDQKFTLPRIKLAAFKLIHGLAIVGFFGIIVLFSSLFLSPRVELNEESTIRTQQDYDTSFKDLVGSNILSKSKITINRSILEADAQKKFPELENIRISTPFFSPRVVMTATVSQPVVELTAGSNSYLVDGRGVALGKGSKEGVLQLDDQTGAAIEVGKPALTSTQMSFISELKHQSDNKQMTIEQLFLMAGGGELDVRFEGVSYLVKFNLYEEPRKSFGTFYATKEEVERTKVQPAEYIDVRVPERSYVK